MGSANGRVMGDWSATHARFAADLLDDCQTELLRLTKTLDTYIGRRTDDPAVLAVATSAPGNQKQILAAAAYFLWVGDHIRLQSARWAGAITSSCIGYATNADQVALLERQMVPSDIIQPPKDPPARPGALANMAMLPAPYLVRLERAREWCGQALWAARQNNTDGMDTVCQHIEMLLHWLER